MTYNLLSISLPSRENKIWHNFLTSGTFFALPQLVQCYSRRLNWLEFNNTWQVVLRLISLAFFFAVTCQDSDNITARTEMLHMGTNVQSQGSHLQDFFSHVGWDVLISLSWRRLEVWFGWKLSRWQMFWLQFKPGIEHCLIALFWTTLAVLRYKIFMSVSKKKKKNSSESSSIYWAQVLRCPDIPTSH